MNIIKRIICLLCVAVIVFQFSSCKSKNTAATEETTQVVKTNNTADYTENWVLSPTINAQSIFSLPITTFNENTNHYDVSFGENYVIEKDGKFGIIDSNGVIVIDPEFDTITTCLCYNGYIATIKEGEYYTTTYHINSANQKLWTYEHTCTGFNGKCYRWNNSSSSVQSIYTSGETSYSVNLTPYLPETMQVSDGSALTDKFAFVVSGKKINTTDYTGAGVFTGGVAAVKDANGKWGYVDSTGKTVLPFEFSAVEGYNALKYNVSTPFECSEGYLTVCKNGKYGIYTADGDLVVPCQYTCLSTVHNGRAYASTDGNTWGILCVDEKISNGIKPDENMSTTTATEYYTTAGSTEYYTTASTSPYNTTTTTTTATTTASTSQYTTSEYTTSTAAY